MPPAPTHRTDPTTVARRGFRDDIQGMRALAVLGILVFHAGLAPYPGGFVTLDVFFVLSGFLITTLLLREVARSGSIDLVAFYVRRARRILPAATVAITGTVVASYLWLHPLDARDAAVDGVWAALFGANIRFAIEETDYFTQSDAPSPLQHFWSLSVEEQFYLVMPVALLVAVVVAVRLARRRAGRVADETRARTTGIVVVLALATAVSLAWSVHASTASPESAYFSTFTRVWEFGAGSLLALAAPWLARRLTPLLRNLVAVGGLGLIVVAMFTITTDSPFPGLLALMPVVGTCLVILAGTGLDDTPLPLAQRALGVRPLRVIGDASYSLYLWHWPVLVIAEQRLQRELTTLDLAVALTVTVVMTWASYRFVETPFRKVGTSGGSRPRPRGMLLYPAAVSVAVVCCLAATHLVDRQLTGDEEAIAVTDYDTGIDGSKLSDDPAVALVQASVRAAVAGRAIPSDLRPALTELKEDRADLGECEYVGTPKKLCLRGDPDGDKTLVVLGNSHGRHWIPALDKITEKAGWKAYYLVKSQCTPVRVQMVRGGQDSPWQGCLDFNAWAEDQMRELAPDLVIVSTSGTPNVEVDGEVVRDTDGVVAELGDGFARLFDDLAPIAGRVVLLEDVPRRRLSPERCLPERDSDLGTCLSGTTNRADAIARLSIEKAEDAGVDVVPTRQWFCDDGKCPAVIKDMVPQRDEGHVTTTYARWLSTPLGRALGLLPSG
ncbi:acyltransferase family protein [Nocardioides hwasunensis]|uniref:Acyltransferase n=1 Tax=Nocardioides hwasunensis TaxID=397258 RepID=A0ABR8MJT6_9ACTN|nr:SGNH hydrolase domain-containing protein [Nocardioides hwasunensis]MBD3916262.1 acyltransferase [Nocardioides hwasunensis]